jgi:hypothetical protein
LTAYPLAAQLGGQLPRLQQASTTKVSVSWAVNRVEDRNGNAATVAYARADGGELEAWWSEMHPSAIRYGPSAGDAVCNAAAISVATFVDYRQGAVPLGAVSVPSDKEGIDRHALRQTGL